MVVVMVEVVMMVVVILMICSLCKSLSLASLLSYLEIPVNQGSPVSPRVLQGYCHFISGFVGRSEEEARIPGYVRLTRAGASQVLQCWGLND